MRIFLCGQKSFGAAALKLCLAAGHQMAGVSSPAGKDRLAFEAGERRIPWMAAGTLNAQTLPENVDLILAAHSHDFIGRATRLRAKLGAIGYHPSLLPRHRGRDAVAWAIKMGDSVTGGSMYWLSDTVDGGDIAAQDWCFVRPADSASELWRRELFPMGLRLMERALKDLARGVMVRIPQDDTLATWEPALDAPPLRRPDLVMLGDGHGYTVIRDRLNSQ
jgi:methionyl-tRNA formyltransferase